MQERPYVEDGLWDPFAKDEKAESKNQNDRCLKTVSEALKAYRRMHSLTSEMIATFFIPQNQEIFESLPEEWHQVVEGWRERYEHLKDELVELGEGE